ncbi:MAG: fibronectin type III domain-containing protein [Tepidisphaeraceae bacterium]
MLESRRLMAAGYQIEVVYGSGVTPALQTAIQGAVSRWQQVITGDVPDVGAGAWGAAVDDLRVTVSVVSIDGAGGGVARTRPTYVRSGSSLPIAGEVQFDSADLATLTSNGQLTNTAIHEMSHAIGFGSLWSTKGLVNTSSSTNPLFTGSQALAEYRTLANDPTATGVPIENEGAVGTVSQHWRRSTFGNELLNGFIVTGTMPLSRVTVAQFADLGYTVNLSAANAYSLPTLNVGGNVFSDANSNGTQNTGEGGLSGRTVYADTNNNNVLDSFEKRATTDASGNFTITGLTPRTYNIRQVLPSGSTQTAPASNAPVAVTIAFGGVAPSGLKFGATPVTTGGTVPATPGTLIAAVASSSQINLAWKDNATNETGYRIEYATNSTFTGATTKLVGANTGYAPITGLAAGTKYYFRVFAYNAAGNSSPTNTANATTSGTSTGGGTPATPGTLYAVAANRNQINLSWKDNATNETAYRIEYATNSSFTGSVFKTVAANTGYAQVTGLTPNTTYYFRVVALLNSTASAPTNVASAKTPA